MKATNQSVLREIVMASSALKAIVAFDWTAERAGVGSRDRRQRGLSGRASTPTLGAFTVVRPPLFISTSPVAELRHKDSSRQYPGAQPLANTTREAASGSAFTTSPVV